MSWASSVSARLRESRSSSTWRSRYLTRSRSSSTSSRYGSVSGGSGTPLGSALATSFTHTYTLPFPPSPSAASLASRAFLRRLCLHPGSWRLRSGARAVLVGVPYAVRSPRPLRSVLRSVHPNSPLIGLPLTTEMCGIRGEQGQHLGREG